MSIISVFSYERVADLVVELNKLHMAQGIKADRERLEFFADELSKTGYTYDQIVCGINSLKTAEINKLTLPLILRFVSENMPKKSVMDYSGKLECRYCNDSGMVTLMDKSNYAYAFACVCNQQTSFTKWNGEFNFKHYEYHSADKYYKRGAYSI